MLQAFNAAFCLAVCYHLSLYLPQSCHYSSLFLLPTLLLQKWWHSCSTWVCPKLHTHTHTGQKKSRAGGAAVQGLSCSMYWGWAGRHSASLPFHLLQWNNQCILAPWARGGGPAALVQAVSSKLLGTGCLKELSPGPHQELKNKI